MKKYTIKSVEDLINPVEYILGTWVKQVLIHGELWAWKTTFVQAFVHKILWETVPVQSPTYTYMNIYKETILHIDMWRIEDEAMVHELWIDDALDTHEWSFIERPKREKKRSTPWAITITIEKNGDTRILTLQE